MAAWNFPSSPTEGQQYSHGGRTWAWRSAHNAWLQVAVSTSDADSAAASAIAAASASRLTVGTITTGAPGSAAVVSITGPAGSQQLNLTIPTGPEGDPGPTGVGIASITQVSGNGSPGSVDVYRITLDNAAYYDFSVYNGADGSGSGVGDMLKSVYDPTNSGKVLSAEAADSVAWAGVSGKPAVIAAGSDAATARTSIGAASEASVTSLSDSTTSALGNKVDKVAGKGLTEAEFTSAEKSKLAGIAVGATANVGDMLKSVYDPTNSGKVLSAEAADSVPWAGVSGKPAVIAAGADAAAARTAIDAESAIVATTADKYFAGNKTWVDFATSVRASVLTGLSLASNAVIAASDSVLVAFGKLQKQISDHIGVGGSAHATVTAGGAAGFMSGAAMTKLNGIASGATANSTDAYLLARVNHTGTQLLSTIAQSGATDGQLAKWSQANARWEPTTVSAGGGLTTVHVTGTTASYTAAVGENVSIESTVAVTVSAPPGLTAGQKWGVMVCNDRWDNVVNMNGNKHENLSDAAMTLKSDKIALEFEMINTSFGQKVKVL